MDEYFVEEKTSFDKIMMILVFLAVFVITIFLILDIIANSKRHLINLANLNAIYFWVDISVLIIFIVDLYRLWEKSTGVKDFFEHNWLDVIATIPFGLIGALSSWTVLNALKWARIAKYLDSASKFSRASKITKEFKAASHLEKESEEYKKKHRL